MKHAILVTGGTGFIGANLVRRLLDSGKDVTVLDNLSSGCRHHLDLLPLKIVEGDILDTELLQRTLAQCDAVVHLAAQTGVPSSLLDPRSDCQINVVGTLNVLEACRLAAIDRKRPGQLRLVFASSNAPLGRQLPPANEEKAPLPISPYGASKLAGEGYCLAYHGSFGLGTVVLRFANVYGPFSLHKNSVVAKVFKDICCTGQIRINGDGSQTRDFIYVDDLCRAISLALETNISGEVFQIASGVETSILELVAQIQKTAGTEFPVSYEPFRQGDIEKNYSLIEKARRLLNWEPTVELSLGLRETWRWFQQQRAGELTDRQVFAQ